MNEMHIEGVYYLKIDTEGHDTVILKKFYQEITCNKYLPHVILFESNILTNKEDVEEIIDLFTKKGYVLIHRGHDTILHLNLTRLQDKSGFSEAFQHYYIMEYPPDYDIKALPHKNTLEGAKEYCIKHTCSGVTYQDGIYQVRNGPYMKYFKGSCVSWVFL
jgi:hypothetical protein